MASALAAIAEAESPSHDLAATHRCAGVISDLSQRLLGVEPQVLVEGGRTHLRWTMGTPRVMLLGHLDTVWPSGTLATFPVTASGDLMSGPGVFDMKAGIVQGLYAIAAAGVSDVSMLITSDEEIGSPSSRGLVEESARDVRAVLVLEPSVSGNLKVARKGGGGYKVRVFGRAAHAGLEPERGVNAVVEMARQIVDVAKHARPELGTTVTPTVAKGGTTTNTIPDEASFAVDARAATREEQDRVDAALRELGPTLEGASIEVSGGINRPPLDRSASGELFELARATAARLGLGPLEGVAVGGGSDGNFTAGMDIPTLDGLGAVGDFAHARGEYVLLSAMPERAGLVAGLLRELADSGAP